MKAFFQKISQMHAFAFVSGLLNKSTGNVLNVDGGVAAAFVR